MRSDRHRACDDRTHDERIDARTLATAPVQHEVTMRAFLCVVILASSFSSGCAAAWRTLGGAAADAVEATHFELDDGYARIVREYCINGTCGRVVTEYRNETLHPPDGEALECAIECVDAEIDLDWSLIPEGYDSYCWTTRQSPDRVECDKELQRLAGESLTTGSD